MPSERTIYINLFSGPGAGKSGVAAGVYAGLKASHVNVELVREVAKEFLIRGEEHSFNNQVLITAIQYDRQLVLDGKVSVVVTDSPILLGLIYPSKRGCNDHWRRSVVSQFMEFRNLNYYLVRGEAYSPVHRVQTESGAIAKDIEIRTILDSEGIAYRDIVVGPYSAHQIVMDVVNLVNPS